MDTFEDLGLNPELVESLASEGLEEPTELQADLLPVLLRENSLLVRGGPGSGVPSACAAGLLQRTQAGPGAPLQGLVLVPVESEAVEFARSMARLALGTGHRVAALGGPFALPELAQVLVGTPDDILAEAESGRISLDSVHMVCALSADALAAPPETGERLEAVRALLARREDPVQWVMASEPVSPAVRAFADAHLKRAVHIPSDAAREVPPESPVRRGRLALQVVDTEVGTALAAHVSRLLDGEDVDHVLLFARTEDRAADLGDLLALHGFVPGAPGETDRPLWLGVDAGQARKAADGAGPEPARRAVVSVGTPVDADELDRRHGGGYPGLVLLHGRELPHLRRIAGEAGYDLEPAAEDRNPMDVQVAALRETVESAVENSDLLPWHVVLEPLVEAHGARTVAAALARALRARQLEEARDASRPARGTGASMGSEGGGPQAFVRLFISVGSRDGLGPGDLLGAITGESGIRGDQVGRIDLRDTFTRVDVEEEVAERVIRALNGVSIRGRSVRADFDRSTGRSGSGQGGGTPRKGGSSRGGGGGRR